MPQKEKAGTLTPASPFSLFRSLKDLATFFLLRRFLRLLFLLGFRFFCFFLWRGFLLRRFLGRLLRHWPWRGLRSRRLFFGLLADDHQLLFLGFDDLFRFARQFFVVQPRQLVVILYIVLLHIHSILPWRHLCPPSAN